MWTSGVKIVKFMIMSSNIGEWLENLTISWVLDSRSLLLLDYWVNSFISQRDLLESYFKGSDVHRVFLKKDSYTMAYIQIFAYSDHGYVGDRGDRKSTIGYLIFVQQFNDMIKQPIECWGRVSSWNLYYMQAIMAK